jgi:hypothetical protein
MQAKNFIEKTEMKPITELVLPIDKFSDWILDQTKICDTTKMSEGIFKGKPVSSRITFKFGASLLIQFDKAVLLALISEYDAGNEFVSFQRLFETLGGGNHLTPKMKAKLSKSIEKLMNTFVDIDMGEIVNARYKGNQAKLKSMLLPCKLATAEIKGKITDGVIQLLGHSPLLDVADIKSQIARIPVKIISELPLRSTEATISLAWYLLERVTEIVGSNSSERKKRVHKLQTTILLTTLYTKCGFIELNRDQRQKLRKSIEIILEHFKNCSLITSFEFIKKNGINYSIEIC